MYHTLGAPRSGELAPPPINFEWEEMKNSLKALKNVTYSKSGAPRSRALAPPPVNFEWEEMKNALKDLKDGIDSKNFKFENDCLYRFEKTIIMTPFPKHFEIPKFDNFRGKSDPVTHVKEFYMHCQEVAYNDVFIM